ncbi:MAG: GMC oxidoreductase, partial [Candidatus Rokuibacteriota bacterium]
MNAVTAADAAGEVWDVVVVGTGVGGAALGYALAQAGRRVLFCERGLGSLPAGTAIVGDYPELLLPGARPPTRYDAELLLRSGRFPDELTDATNRRAVAFVPFVGCGAGGSSALYGMALERFLPSDFEP